MDMVEYPELQIDIALVHYPVINRNGETIGSAVTNLDIHDIARAGKTYGIGTYWLVTPYEEQQELAGEIVGHWTKGYGGRANSDRGNALSIVRICADLEEVIRLASEKFSARPLVLSTCAKPQPDTIEYAEMRTRIWEGEPVLLLLGTAWGLAPELLTWSDATLPPLCGKNPFNHLSVRSAASIIMDRLLSVSP